MKKHKIILTVLVLLVVVTVIPIIINWHVIISTKNRILLKEDAYKIDADCILVLGAGVKADKTPSAMLNDRLVTSIDLYTNGAGDKLLMSGDHGRIDYDEVNVMKTFATDREVPSIDVFMDHAGFSTYESMYRAKYIFGVKKVIIVTQEYHMYRALYIARSLGLDAYGVTSSTREYGGQSYRDKREILARIKDFFTAVYKPKPTYMGGIIPISGNGDVTNDKEDL